jgi:hypothetical protein
LEWAQSLKDDATRQAALSVLPEYLAPTDFPPTMDEPADSPVKTTGEVTNLPPAESAAVSTNAPMAE